MLVGLVHRVLALRTFPDDESGTKNGWETTDQSPGCIGPTFRVVWMRTTEFGFQAGQS